MARPKGSSPHDPAAIAYAVEAVRSGRSSREIAAELAELDVHVSHMTVKRWADAAAKGESPARPPQKAGPPPAPEVSPTPAPPSAPPTAQAPSLAERLRARAEAAPPPPAVDPDAPFDLAASLPRWLRQAEAEAREHELASNPKGAQAAMRRAADMVKVLAVVNKAKPSDPDVLQFSRAEIDRAYLEMTGTLENLMSRPVLCSECSRELSIKFGRGQS